MNWYNLHKSASPKLNDPDMRNTNWDQAWRPAYDWEKDKSPQLMDYKATLKPQDSGRAVFELLKASGAKVKTYHGTTLKYYKEAQKSGYLLCPGYLGRSNFNKGVAKDDFIYTTPIKQQAVNYTADAWKSCALAEAKRFYGPDFSADAQGNKFPERGAWDFYEGSPNDPNKIGELCKPVVVEFSVPIHTISEIKTFLLSGISGNNTGSYYTGNFNWQHDGLKNNLQAAVAPLVECHKSKGTVDPAMIDNCVERLSKTTELTFYKMLPIKWATSVEFISSSDW